ncbi:MAG: T9SS type A sorting domain-containing protein [Candidatus Kapabacteria bacterium]|nr:T9SS type A sorting domain-containing protein [Candidatus Kapabacteria bacterium]
MLKKLCSIFVAALMISIVSSELSFAELELKQNALSNPSIHNLNAQDLVFVLPTYTESNNANQQMEIKDTMPPYVYYELCKGTTDTTMGKYPYVMDMPDDDAIRTNMGSIVFNRNTSFNYDFSIHHKDKDWVPGVTRTVRWKAWVLDTKQDAVGYITFTDFGGNDTTIKLEYFADEVGVSEPDYMNGYYLGKINQYPIGNEEINMQYSIGKYGETRISIIASDGTIVRELVNDFINEGQYSVSIPIDQLPSGVYFIEMRSGEFREVQKIVIVK